MSIRTDVRLSDLAAAAVQALPASPASHNTELAISLIDLSTPEQPQYGNYQGDKKFYPASMVKLFFLAAACIELERNAIQATAELLSAIQEMIVDSSNSAAGYVVDVLTGTESGEKLDPKEMDQWSVKRRKLNDLFLQRGYSDINVCQKTWDETPSERDEIFLGADQINRNCLTANSTAKLLEEIVLGKIANQELTSFMMKLLKRDFFQPSDDPDNQATGFLARALPADARLWSKAGWTSEVRHDAAYIEFPGEMPSELRGEMPRELRGGARLIMVVFTRGCSDNREIIPELASSVLAGYTR